MDGSRKNLNFTLDFVEYLIYRSHISGAVCWVHNLFKWVKAFGRVWLPISPPKHTHALLGSTFILHRVPFYTRPIHLVPTIDTWYFIYGIPTPHCLSSEVLKSSWTVHLIMRSLHARPKVSRISIFTSVFLCTVKMCIPSPGGIIKRDWLRKNVFAVDSAESGNSYYIGIMYISPYS